MLDYEFWSAPIYDLSDWSSKGINYRAEQDALYSKERPYMYAPDVVRGNDGKYYLYYGLSGFKERADILDRSVLQSVIHPMGSTNIWVI